jgi:altronate dehydratase
LVNSVSATPVGRNFDRLIQAGDTTMLTRTKMALASALIIIGAASAARANDNDSADRWKTETTQEVPQARHATANPGASAYGFVSPRDASKSHVKAHRDY